MNLTSQWYREKISWMTFYLLPLSFLYRMAVACRRFLYKKNFLKTYSFSVPVIVVGNITVGGTGKTPVVIWLAEYLTAKGLKPGIVTRGVGGAQQRAPRWVSGDSLPAEVGDEALLLEKRTRCPVVIGIDRVAAVKELLQKTNCNVVISDDGLQHYRLQRDIEIAIIDGSRGLGNGAFIPAGPLRESISRLQETDLVIWHQANTPDKLTMHLQGDIAISLQTQTPMPLVQFKKVHAVAAIGNPQRFFESLAKLDIEVIEHPFPDHYLFSEDDLKFNDNLPILMTEKDVVKCQQFINANVWYVPVSAVVSENVSSIIQYKLTHIKKVMNET